MILLVVGRALKNFFAVFFAFHFGAADKVWAWCVTHVPFAIIASFLVLTDEFGTQLIWPFASYFGISFLGVLYRKRKLEREAIANA